LADGASAILVQPGNVKALKDAILNLLSNEKLAAEIGEKNLMFAQKESWGVVAAAYEEAYLELSTS
jgi:glycosyltransferase involved in cell wall biosynthesis